MTGFSALSHNDVEEDDRQWQGSAKVSGPKYLKMPLLTIGMFGLQIIWSVEMSYASPYLVSLGLSRSFMSIVFLAGPLSGLIVQPLIGVFSDHSHSRFGRRRPYILLGILVAFFAMYLLGFTRSFASIFTHPGSTWNNNWTIALAVFSIYLIDFSINAVQAMDRALLVDLLPASEQEKGNAWAGRMFGLGSVIGFFVGNVDLTVTLPFFGSNQLEILCVVTSALLLTAHCITLFNISERVLLPSTDRTKPKLSLFGIVKDIWQNFLWLPSSIKQICLIQLFAWIAWFPVLFWSSLYIGGLYKQNSSIPSTEAEQQILEDEATRLGSRALLYNAIVSLVASIFCPFFVSRKRRVYQENENLTVTKPRWKAILHNIWKDRPTCHLAVLWSVSHGLFAACMLSTFFIKTVRSALIALTISGFSWAITQWAPFALIAEAIHTTDSSETPHFLIGDEDASSDVDDVIPLRDTRTHRGSSEQIFGNGGEVGRDSLELKHEDAENEAGGKRVRFADEISELESPLPRLSKESDDASFATTSLLSMNATAQRSQETLGYPHEDSPGDRGSTRDRSIEDKAGIILGIHNVFVVIPQFIITGLSSIIFAIMDPEKSVLDSHGRPAHPGGLPSIPIGNYTAGDNTLAANVLMPRVGGEDSTRNADSVAIIFRLGGMSAAIACVLAIRLSKQLKRAR